MKILIVTPYFKCSKHGGTERYVSNLYDQLIKKYDNKLDISILTTKTNYCTSKKNIYIINSKKEILNFNPILFNIFKIYSLLKNNNFDLVHIHGHLYFINFFVAIFCKILQKKVILTLHGGIDLPNKIPLKSKILKIAYDRIFGCIIKKAVNGITSVSKTDLEKYMVNHNKIVKQCYIPNAININQFEYKNRYQSKKRKYVLGYIGDLEYWKGVDILLNICLYFANHPDIEIRIAGEGKYKDTFLKLSEKFKNINYLGKIEHSKVPEFYHSIDLFIFPSRWEGLPTTILESMACGCVVIANQLPELKRVFSTNEIYFTNESNSSSFISSINSILNNEQDLNKKSLYARKMIEKRFTFDKITEQYFKFYNLVIQN